MGFSKGVFGTSPARARWRLQRVMLAMWTLIFAAGCVAARVLATPWWLTLQLYLVGLAVFHAWHWSVHQRWIKPLRAAYKIHLFHHWSVYPPRRFLSKVYLDDKAGRTAAGSLLHDGPLYVGMLGNVALLVRAGVVDATGALFAVAVYAFVGSFANWLHHSFHILGHPLERLVYFHDLRALHYTHHQNTALHNYGFLDFAGDALTNTMRRPDYALSNTAHAGRENDGDSDAAATATATATADKSDKIGDGNEHVSNVQPGALPTLVRDGVKECTFVGVCFLIELIVGALGVVFGAARDADVNARAKTSTKKSTHAPPPSSSPPLSSSSSSVDSDELTLDTLADADADADAARHRRTATVAATSSSLRQSTDFFLFA